MSFRSAVSRAGVIAALAALPGATPAQAPATGRALAIEDWYRVLSVGGVDISPDGRWVAYTVSRRIEATNSDSTAVWVVSSSGDAPPRRVSSPGQHATNPQWSDDGALRFSAAGRSWVADPASGADPADAGPAAGGGRGGRGGGGGGGGGGGSLTSPGGRWIASLRAVRPAPVAEPERSEFEKRHEARFKGVQFDWLNFQRDGAPFPAPNTADPRVSPPQEIVIVPAAGGEERQVTRLGLRPTATQWHPDGNVLAFTADSQYRDERRYGSNQVWLVQVDGAVRRLTRNDEYTHSGIDWSPDGQWILTTRRHSTDAVIARKMNHGGPTDLVLVPATGGAERVLTADWDLLPSAPRWSPDGRYVYFSGGIGGGNHLFRVSAAGGAVEQVTRGERRIGALSFSRDLRRMAFTVGRIEGPPEIHVADIDGRNERRLTSVHESLEREIALGRGERLRYPSRDGTEIEGWLIAPHGYRPDGGPYPLVVNNHGGPHSAVGYSFDFKNQFLAANGYFVLTVNFRSSTGYGEKFLWGTWGAWGDRDGEDVIAGIDHVIARYPIDRNRVATIGHSYGGFMSNWLIVKYPERFAAAAVGAGIVNWVSDYGTADIARTKETEFFGTPWEEEARNIMIRQSPLTWAGQARAATLFIHGEVDQRVPYSEAEQMYVALRKNGVPAKIIQYEGMPHGISGSWNNVHRLLNELRWLDTWLKPKGVS
jgi:dipeptidyl aminopeptidase/acylaminoacyl peptidase